MHETWEGDGLRRWMEFVEKFSEAVEENIRKDPGSGRNGSGKWAQDSFLP